MHRKYKVGIAVLVVAGVGLAIYVGSKKEGQGEGIFGSGITNADRISGGIRFIPFV